MDYVTILPQQSILFIQFVCDNVKRCNISNVFRGELYSGIACLALQSLQTQNFRIQGNCSKSISLDRNFLDILVYERKWYKTQWSNNDDIIGELIYITLSMLKEIGQE